MTTSDVPADLPADRSGRARPESRTAAPLPLMPTSAGWLVAIYLGLPALLVLIQSGPRTLTEFAKSYAATWLATLWIGGTLHAAYVFVLPRVLSKVRARAAIIACHVATISASVTLGALPVDPLVKALDPRARSRGMLYESVIAASIAAVAVVALTTYVRMQRQARDVERREHEARQLALAAQLQALQARTNPHFLFNSLNTVASLIPTDPELAELTLVRLAELFRYALQVSTRSRVTLDEELDATRDYLRVESLRLGDRLRWEVDVQAGLERVPTPPLLLQPLVENAIVHGVSRERSGGTVRVVVRAEPRDVVFEVHDDGSGRSDRVGTGTALDDLRKRLELCYGGRAQLERKVGDGHVVCVRIPREEGLCAR